MYDCKESGGQVPGILPIDGLTLTNIRGDRPVPGMHAQMVKKKDGRRIQSDSSDSARHDHD